MKSLIYVLVIAILHKSCGFPVEKEVNNPENIFLSSSADMKFFDIKSESVNIPLRPSIAKTKMIKEPATIEKVIAKEGKKSEDVLKPVAVGVGDQPIKPSESSNIVSEPAKLEVKPLALLENKRLDQLNVKEESVSEIEASRKELKDLLVDESKSLQNEVRSDIQNVNVKTDDLKSDVPASPAKKKETNTDNVGSNEAQIKHEVVKDEVKLENAKDDSHAEKIEIKTDKNDSKEDQNKYEVSVVSVLNQVNKAEPVLKVDASTDRDVPNIDLVDTLKSSEEIKTEEFKPLSTELFENKDKRLKMRT